MVDKYILLVEDNRDDELLTLRALEKGNVTNSVKVVRDGVEALKFLEQCEVLPQVVLLDLKLPKVDGIDVLRKVRANPKMKRLPVVILTSSREDQDIIQTYDLGANSYICKPVDMEQFYEAVRQLGLYWFLLNEPPQG